MKAFTDLNQSKKLAELLPLESADMYYACGAIAPDIMISNKQDYKCYTVCWSLAALLDVFPMTVGRDLGMYCCWQNSKNLHSRHYDNPVDACYEMILKLNKFNML